MQPQERVKIKMKNEIKEKEKEKTKLPNLWRQRDTLTKIQIIKPKVGPTKRERVWSQLTGNCTASAASAATANILSMQILPKKITTRNSCWI